MAGSPRRTTARAAPAPQAAARRKPHAGGARTPSGPLATTAGASGLATSPSASVSRPEGRPGSTATQRVYDGIYNAILEHRLPPGTWLREEELAGSFEVSRTVVRQALHRLAQDQVLEQIHNRGTRVPQPGRELAAHVFDARRIVECEIARRLAGRLDAGQLGRLEAMVRAEAEADARGDRPAAIRLSGEFHRVLAELCGNPVFVRMIEELLPTTSLLMALYHPASRPVCVAHRHVELIEALRGAGATAAAEMRRHLAEIEQSLSSPAPAATALRDVFAGYREGGDEPAPRDTDAGRRVEGAASGRKPVARGRQRA